MDRGTIILMLSIGSFVYGLLLIAFQYKKSNSEKIPFWVMAKFLQAIGSLILWISNDGHILLITMLGNNALILGCAYEAWAIRIIANKKVDRKTHMLTSIGITLICSSAMLLTLRPNPAVIFLLQSIFYFLPCWFLLYKGELKSPLGTLLGISYFITGMLFFIFAFMVYGNKVALYVNIIRKMLPVSSFCIFIISGFIMLMLAKERSDIQLQEVKKTLKKSEIQFQRIVETAIEGIFTFDKNFAITFANENMARMLGYTTEELLGKNLTAFVPEDQLSSHKEEMSSRLNGKDAVYERCLRRKDGQEKWFLISAKAIRDDFGNIEGSFAMLTDIDQRKKTELLLEESNRQLAELTKQDGLTGIANRRYFDEVLNHEYFRLKRSSSKFSIILLDIDFFKAFNDCYGHVEGDQCLRQIGKVLAGFTSRSVDLAARYGGEEFALILPDTDIKAAVIIAENIRQGIEGLNIPHKGSSVSDYVTASIGVTTVTYVTEKSIPEIIDEVDKLLYRAKTLGRNRVESEKY